MYYGNGRIESSEKGEDATDRELTTITFIVLLFLLVAARRGAGVEKVSAEALCFNGKEWSKLLSRGLVIYAVQGSASSIVWSSHF